MNLSSDENLSEKSLENETLLEPTLNTRRVARNQSASAKRKENLSGIEEESDFEFEMSRLKPSASSTPRISNDDDATDDEDLGFDPKKPKATSSKLDLFDDILGGALSDAKRPATASASSTAPQPAARRRDERRPAVSRQSTDTTTDNSTAQRPKTSTGRRGSGLSGINTPDPLGLFSQPAKEATKKRGSTADWLGLSVATEPNDDHQSHVEQRAESPKTPRAAHKPSNPTQMPAYDILKLNDTLEAQEAADTTLTANEPMPVALDVAARSMLQLNNMNLETRSAFNMLQQQESQLTLAAQMKQQERALLEMQRRQETLLQQQERQFQNLMQQQLQRQQNLEEGIKMQQQRINAHIQLMLTQPATAFNMAGGLHYEESTREVASAAEGLQEAPTARHESQAVSQTTLDRIQIETDSRRLELEKLRLEELVANTKSNYEREIEVIEATYKKQIKLLDEHAEILETRLRAEIAGITDYYKEKIAALEAEQQKSKNGWETELATLKQDHEDELRRVRKSYEEDLELLRDEQRRMLETVQRTKMLEFAAVQDNSNYLDALKAASANLSEATTDLQSLKEQLQLKLETANQQKQQALEARERLLADKERRLQLSEASAEQEKVRLMTLVANLEQQLATLNKETSDENWQLRLKLSALEAEKAAFEREREYAREQMQRDEQRLAALKAEQIAEVQRVKLELQEERRQLQLEKTRFETQQKLRTNSSGLEKERCDLEIAMKCAQEAARQADDERQRYFTQHCELEQLKRELVDKESTLRAKQEQLNMELRACSTAEEQAKDVTKRARLIEQNFQEKLQTLQQRTRELAEKEAFLAEERQLLAQQRLAIKEVQQRLAQRQCPACQQLGSSSSNHDSPRLQSTTKIGPDVAQPPTNTISTMCLVDRLLDDNIAESLKRLQTSIAQQQTNAGTSTGYAADISNNLCFQPSGYSLPTANLNLWPTLPPTGLDDDSKTLALNNFDNLQYEIGLIKSAAEAAATLETS